MVRRMFATSMTLAALLAMQPAEGGAKRGNDAHARRRGAVFSVVAAPRLGILLAGGADVIRPVGFGAGFSFRVHALHLGPLRLGGAVDLGHTRFIEPRTVSGNIDGQAQTARRFAALAHTDFGLGPSLQIVMGPIYLQGDLTVGLGISAFSRPTGVLTNEEEHHSDVSAMLRTGGLLGVPIRNNQGITIGASVQRYFSTYQLVADPDAATDPSVEVEPDTNPFDLALDVSVGYLFQF